MLNVIIDAALLAASFGAGFWYGKRRAIAAAAASGTNLNLGSGASSIGGGF